MKYTERCGNKASSALKKKKDEAYHVCFLVKHFPAFYDIMCVKLKKQQQLIITFLNVVINFVFFLSFFKTLPQFYHSNLPLPPLHWYMIPFVHTNTHCRAVWFATHLLYC